MLLPELKAKLVAEGLTTGYTVRDGLLPATPDLVIAINETGGSGPEQFGSSPSIEMPAVQVMVRGAAYDYATPRLQAERIYQALQDWGAWAADNGTRYLKITPLQAPFPFNRDDNTRVVFAVNFLIEKELSPLA